MKSKRMKPVHILLIEDNEGDILFIKEAFEETRLANEITVLRNGEKAIKYLQKKGEYQNAITPDLIILDVNLPRKSGHEVLQFIKFTGDLKVIPVIMLTTSSSDQDITKSYENYVNCYITKPAEVDEFLEAVTRIENFWFNLVKLPVNN